MRTGAVISAAGHSGLKSPFRPMLPVGDSTVIRRIIITLQQAGIEPVVVITGAMGDELEKHIAKLRVICLRNEQYESTQMFDSICIGLRYIAPLCDQVLVLPAKYPMFLPDTVERLLKSGGQIACPVFDGRRGHPVLLSSRILSRIISYEGGQGLRGAIRHLESEGVPVRSVSVEDEGIAFAVEQDEDCKKEAVAGKKIDIHPTVQLTLERDLSFFGPSMARFLQLIGHTGSMQTACRQMHMSYTKGWKLIKEAEKQLDFHLLVTRSGGADGGFSQLTPEAERFLEGYLAVEKELKEEGKRLFQKYFPDLN